MEEFWNAAQKAMDMAVETAESVSKKGKEFAAESAEEATRQFRNLQERQKAFVASSTRRADESIAARVSREDMQREMEEYGITDAFIEGVKQLDYSTFRDFHQSAEESTGSAEKKLNKWQERHALLLIKNVKEIDELRFVLCPKYMNDSQFWDTYFKVMKNDLPNITFSWKEGDALPRPYSESKQEATASLDFLEDQFKSFGEKASSAVFRAGASAGVDMSNLLSAMDLSDKANSIDRKEAGLGTDVSDSSTQQKQTLLDADPDLEEYLGDMYGGGDNDCDDAEDSDLDEYLNELTNSSRKDDDAVEQQEDGLNDDDLEALIQGVSDD